MLDAYVIRARFFPPLLVVLPLAASVLAWVPSAHTEVGLIGALVSWCGGAFLVGQLGRDRGRRAQAGLFLAWGGSPTTQHLRHRSDGNAEIRRRRHSAIKTALADVVLPTPKQEADDSGAADDAYEAATAALRELTRDRKRFPLVFSENCSFGFRRNLWALKPFGVATSLAGGAAAMLAVWAGWGAADHPIPIAAIAATVASFVLGACWLFVFTPTWVRVAADAYAAALLGAAELLAADAR